MVSSLFISEMVDISTADLKNHQKKLKITR